MFPTQPRSRRIALAALSLLAISLIATFAWALPGRSDGEWVLTWDLECEDSSKYCVVWELTTGETVGQACCVTAWEFAQNIPCSDFRTKAPGS